MDTVMYPISNVFNLQPEITMNNWKKVFAIIWTGQLFSILSSTIVGFAIVIWLSIKTESAEVLALSTMAALLPQSLLGLVSGVFVDRWKRKLTMVLSDSFIAFCTLLMAILFFLGTVEIWHIYLLLTFRSAGSAFHSPAMQASIPLLAPANQLTRIAGINQVIYSVCNIAGPALGALLIGMMDISYILLLDVLGAAIACISLLFVSIPDPEKKERTKLNILKDLKDAYQGVRQIKGMATLIIFCVMATFVIMPVSALFPLMTLKHFMGDAFQMSIVEVGWGVGMLVGGAVMGIFSVRTNRVVLVNIMYVLLGATFFFSGLLPADGFWWFVALTAIGGMSGSIYNASFVSVIQIRVAPEILGRVFSVFGSVNLLPAMIGLLGTGYIADSIGIDNSFLISGGVVCLIGVISFFYPSMLALGKDDN